MPTVRNAGRQVALVRKRRLDEIMWNPRRSMKPHRVILVALACLFTLAISASAECAWVLWGQTVDPWNASVALPLGAWTSRDECDQERIKRGQEPPELRMAVYVCLPDTVDPRGPKEK